MKLHHIEPAGAPFRAKGEVIMEATMLFELNDEQRAFQKRVREIYEREVSPLVEEYERKEAFPVQLFPILGAEHLLCLRCPKKYGGLV